MTLETREELAKAIRDVSRELAAMQENLVFLILLSEQLQQSQGADSAPINQLRHTGPLNPQSGEPPYPLPDVRIVKRVIANRHLRSRFISAKVFGDPAWDMLLDLFAATLESRVMSVTALSAASGLPATSAIHWVQVMIEAGFFERPDNSLDLWRGTISLTPPAIDALAQYFLAIGGESNLLA